jgi:phosphoenolpyruvate synthase/pyruvate phosphate dikinase
MVYGFAVQAERQGDQLKDTELEKSIRRNFSGLDDLDPMKIFSQQSQFQKLKRYVKV